MKTILAVLLPCVLFAAEPLSPCCHPPLAAGQPTDKSLYLLDSTWTSDVGRQIKLGALRGRPQIVAMFFTHCEYACPILVSELKTIGDKLPPEVLGKVDLPLRTAPLAAQLALLALAVGLIFPLFWPGQRIAGLHVVFLGGFSLITFTVATRVVLGHSGNEALFETRLPALQIATFLILAGTVLRTVGDFLVARPHWLNGASYLWMPAAGVWGFSVLPKVRLADPDGDISCSARRARTAP